MRWTRPIAWRNAARSRSGSKKTARDACVKLRPTPPAATVVTSTVQSHAMALSRFAREAAPVNDAVVTSEASSAATTSGTLSAWSQKTMAFRSSWVTSLTTSSALAFAGARYASSTVAAFSAARRAALCRARVSAKLRTATDQRPPWGTSKTSSSKSKRSSAQKRPLQAGQTTDASVRWGRATLIGGTSSS